ncbi:hypothetical protein LGK95_19235 [Clostridium algoriphilum]|uniref:hypothetical protein n=1 Tax=Clostridium algoriphilum TaxID=198347 RepID=UPI001CF38A37|nr:hypothetical protein [Clostridium algoriphilum]MCB2295616.1 hypothetical protein [Clostridium algoriphilum]
MSEYNGKHLSVIKAVEIMGKLQQFVRVGLQRGLLTFGTALKMSSMWTYYISPKQFCEYVSVDEKILNGRNSDHFPPVHKI